MKARTRRARERGQAVKISRLICFAALFCLMTAPFPAVAEMMDMPVVRLQSLDKTTARTMTFEAKVGSTVKFGPLYIKIQSCRKAPPVEQPESASFLQVWEVTPDEKAKWVFSGWMFASSPALSSMDHPIYDVWVIDCIDPAAIAAAAAAEEAAKKAAAEAAEKEKNPKKEPVVDDTESQG